MKAMTKIILMGASVLSMGALTACQSTANVEVKDYPRMMKDHHKKHDLSPEQREKFEQMRADHIALQKQIKSACDGKTVGSAVQIKVGDQTIDGTCKMVFKADRKDMKHARGEYKGMKGEHRSIQVDAKHTYKANEILTDAKRAELVKQYDLRLAQRQAMQQAQQTACQSKKHGDAVQIKRGEKILHGQCQVRFQPNAQIKPSLNQAS